MDSPVCSMKYTGLKVSVANDSARPAGLFLWFCPVNVVQKIVVWETGDMHFLHLFIQHFLELFDIFLFSR